MIGGNGERFFGNPGLVRAYPIIRRCWISQQLHMMCCLCGHPLTFQLKSTSLSCTCNAPRTPVVKSEKRLETDQLPSMRARERVMLPPSSDGQPGARKMRRILTARTNPSHLPPSTQQHCISPTQIFDDNQTPCPIPDPSPH